MQKTVVWNKEYETYEYDDGEKILTFRDSFDAMKFAEVNGLVFVKQGVR